MVCGLGIDVVEISRIERLRQRYSAHFLDKVFTPAEQDYCNDRAAPGIHYAGRWAAKEAFYKALPVSCQPLASWKTVEIIGRPGLLPPDMSIIDERLAGKVAEFGIEKIFLSISHEKCYCVACVILECQGVTG